MRCDEEDLEKDYKIKKAIEASYNVANDDKKKEAAREEMRKFIQNMDEKYGYVRIFKEYSDARDRENKYIDLNDVMDEQIPEIVERFRYFGIDHFTFSSTWSGAIQSAWLFTENGCVLEGITLINGEYPEEKIPAYVFRIQ